MKIIQTSINPKFENFMRQVFSIQLLVFYFIVIGFSDVAAQDAFYGLKSQKSVKSSPTKDLQRKGTCWSNAGAALMEAEMLRMGKKAVDLQEMDFIHNAFLLKADLYVETQGKFRVGENGIAYDVIKCIEKYGMAPESAYMAPAPMETEPASGEMEAVLRGTLMMALQKDGQFTDRWSETYDAALSNYIGETLIEFDYDGKKLTPETFAKNSGLVTSDYILMTSDTRQPVYKPFVLTLKDNWGDDKFYNVSQEDLISILNNSVNAGYAAVWCGNVDKEQVFAAENVAIVPATKLTGTESTTITDKNPLPEKSITASDRQLVFETLLDKKLSNMLVTGISKDKKGANYLTVKNVCESGDKALNLSENFVKLNTVYLLINKRALPDNLKGSLGM